MTDSQAQRIEFAIDRLCEREKEHTFAVNALAEAIKANTTGMEGIRTAIHDLGNAGNDIEDAIRKL